MSNRKTEVKSLGNVKFHIRCNQLHHPSAYPFLSHGHQRMAWTNLVPGSKMSCSRPTIKITVNPYQLGLQVSELPIPFIDLELSFMQGFTISMLMVTKSTLPLTLITLPACREAKFWYTPVGRYGQGSPNARFFHNQ